MNKLNAHRKHYSQLVTAIAGVDPTNVNLISAFATVRREDYLGPGPWEIRAGAGYSVTPTNDPAFLYQNVLVALRSEGRINNGQPSLHARCLDALKVSAGDTVLHVGAGTGYYTAILAELTGPSGSIFAYEIDDELAQRASENLQDRDNVQVQDCSGTIGELPVCDVIYVNAGTTEPTSSWLDALKKDGRLLFPLTSTSGSGGMLLLQRIDDTQYSAKFLGPVNFIPCVGAREEKTAFELADKFKEGNAPKVKSFHRGNSSDNTCWFKWDDCWLSTHPI